MDDPLSAMAVARSLLAAKQSTGPVEILTGDTFWGEIIPVPQKTLSTAPWIYTAFAQFQVAETAMNLINRNQLSDWDLPLSNLEELVLLGPTEMNIKNKKQGLFAIAETIDLSRLGEPALWHHRCEQDHDA